MDVCKNVGLIEILYFSDSTDELAEPLHTESPIVENVLSRLKSIAHLRTAETRKSASDSITREELEALKDLLDRNLQKYQNFNEYSVRKRPNDPYIGQILQNLNEQQSDTNSNNYVTNNVHKHEPQDMPIRRKIIRHTVFATPMTRGNLMAGGNGNLMGVGGAGGSNLNRVYGQNGDAPVGSRIDWVSPWADYFPILIKDPFQSMLNSFSEIIEYGPAADICRSNSGGEGESGDHRTGRFGSAATTSQRAIRSDLLKRSRRNTGEPMEGEKGVLNHVRPFRTTTEKPKMHGWAPEKPAGEHNGDTGPQIKRLIVRRGGVAIAGPGGIATAGSGGTAIVGPGGSAYSSKDTAAGSTSEHMIPGGGLSMAGYGPHAVAPYPYFSPYQQPNGGVGFGRSMNAPSRTPTAARRKSADADDDGGTAVLSSDGVAYTFPVPSRGLTVDADHDDGQDGGNAPYAASTAREISLPDGAKLIATGPIVYYNPEHSAAAAAKKRSRKAKVPKKSSTSESNKKRAATYQRRQL